MPFVTLTTEPGGPIIDVTIGVSHPREMQLRAAQQAVPLPIKVRALIDTGASCSLITQTIVNKLRIPVRGTTPMHTPSTDGTAQDACVYDVSFVIDLTDQQARRYASLFVIGRNVMIQPGVEALIGRDILQHGIFNYNGTAKIFLLGF
jgi:predicted aspartyl protease